MITRQQISEKVVSNCKARFLKFVVHQNLPYLRICTAYASLATNKFDKIERIMCYRQFFCKLGTKSKSVWFPTERKLALRSYSLDFEGKGALSQVRICRRFLSPLRNGQILMKDVQCAETKLVGKIPKNEIRFCCMENEHRCVVCA